MNFKQNTHLVRSFLLQRKGKTFGIILLGIISNLLTIIIPVSIGKYYELVFHFNSRRVKLLGFIPKTIWDTVPKFLIVFIILVVLRFIFFFLHQFLLKKEGEIFVKEIKDYLFNHQLKIKYDVYKEKGIGKYLLRYTGDINSLKNLYLKGSIRIFVDVIMIVIALSWLYILNNKGAIIIVIMSFLAYLIIRLINKKVELYSLEKRNKTSGQLAYVSRTLQSILSVIIFNKQVVEHKKYRKKSRAIKEVAIIYDKWFVINKGFISFIQYAILCMVFYVFYLDTNPENSQEHSSNLISFILLYITILPVIRRLFSLETVFKLGNISLRKLNNIIKIEKEKTQKGEVLVVNNPRIVFESVSFNKYGTIDFSSKKMALSILELPVGVEALHIITAMIRVHEDYVGTITINKEDIKKYAPKSLRENIGVISSEIPLVGRTVYEVITAFRSDKIKEEVRNLLQEIQEQFKEIPNLEMQAKIGENGSKLSTTQYEFLCFVRGIISKKKILLVDKFPLLEAVNKEALHLILEKQAATILKIVAK